MSGILRVDLLVTGTRAGLVPLFGRSEPRVELTTEVRVAEIYRSERFGVLGSRALLLLGLLKRCFLANRMVQIE